MYRLGVYISRKCLQGSFTVEASMVFPIVLLIIEGTLLLGFQIYREGLEYVDTVQPMEQQSAETFRMISFGLDVLGE